jgi:3-deoxy-D-manno-octulosonate 8-phosphate phosphatase (KDO 8-P phosphatase)
MADEAAAELAELLVLDVDGVLTDGVIHIDDHGVETKTFHARDGLGIRLWQATDHHVAIITGRSSMALQHRATELGIRHVFQGVQDKVQTFGGLLRELKLTATQAAVMGDDLNDLAMMRLAGYGLAPADAAAEIREAAHFVTVRPGGRGAVREAIEHLLNAKGMWEEAVGRFE